MPRAIIFPILVALAIPMSLALVAEADSAYRIRIAQWHQGREAALKADGGWLTVTGLFWLKEGANRVGSDPSSDVVLPAGAPANLGVVRVETGAAAGRTTSLE